MNLSSLVAMIPGMGSATKLKSLLEIFSARIIEHVGHDVDKYQLKMIFETGFMEFLIFHPGPVFPDQYKAPMNLQFKGKPRETPEGARWHDMDVNNGMDLIKAFLKAQLKDFDGTMDYVIANINRNSNEVPVIIAYTRNGEKEMIKKVLK